MRIYIATSRDVGRHCIEWAKENLPEGFELVDTMNHCDIFISVLYDKIIPLEYIKSLKGAYNFHPGALPEYRGAATYSWAIVNGEEEVGVTLHKIDEGIDSGDVIDIGRWTIGRHSTAQSVFSQAEEKIESMFRAWFKPLITGQFMFTKQDESKARIYYRKDLDKLKDLTPIVRALHFPGKESCFYYNSKGEKIYIDYEKTS